MRAIISILLILIASACVDRLTYNIAKAGSYGIVVDGFISDQPGPYTIKISKAFDIESKESIKTAISVKHLILSDDQGTSEELTQVNAGIYETKAQGIRGQVGRVYKLRVELLDGKIYESMPDSLLSAGRMDSLYYSFTGISNSDGGTEYGFDIFANSSRGGSSSNRFMWKMTGTFQSETHPEFKGDGCYWFEGKCNYVPPCSGYRNIGTQGFREIAKVFPCECCTCWYSIFNLKPVLSDDHFSTAQNFEGIKIHRIPIDAWIFMHKIHVEVRQLSLTDHSFRFYKAIRDQKNAVNSLFQPVIGKIPVNFIQLNGLETPVQGLFYAAAISSKSLYIMRENVPHNELLPSLDSLVQVGIGWDSCLELFPNATNVRPVFWED
ncbi:MAG: DUF4249 family protein [Bacteroidota bacterium]